MGKRRTLDRLTPKEVTSQIYKTALEYTNIVRYARNMQRDLCRGHPRFDMVDISRTLVLEGIAR